MVPRTAAMAPLGAPNSVCRGHKCHLGTGNSVCSSRKCHLGARDGVSPSHKCHLGAAWEPLWRSERLRWRRWALETAFAVATAVTWVLETAFAAATSVTRALAVRKLRSLTVVQFDFVVQICCSRKTCHGFAYTEYNQLSIPLLREWIFTGSL